MTTAVLAGCRNRELDVLVIGDEGVPSVGDTVCLIEEVDLMWPAKAPETRRRRRATFAISGHPRTNQSHEPRWEGWLGTTNDIDRWAEGAYEIRWIAESDRGAPWYRVSLRPEPLPSSR